MDNLTIKSSLIIFLFLSFGVLLFMGLRGNKTIKKVCYKKHCFEVEVAKSKEEKRKGLMYRDKLKKNQGMLFVYEDPGLHTFWMKNTLIPLDIIWLNKDKKVIYIQHSAPPCKKPSCPSYGPEKSCRYVLEINAGKAKKIGLKKGEKIIFK